MAIEPITIFSRNVDPAGVARRLRQLSPDVQIDGSDEGWTNAVIRCRAGNAPATLTITHDPGYYAEPTWSVQMNGMLQFLSGFPNTERKSQLMMLPTTFKFALGTLFDPEPSAEDDPRLAIIYAVTKLLDGVLFTVSALRDAEGRVLFGTGGEDEEDPDAIAPRVVAEVRLSPPTETATGDQAGAGPEPTEPPSPERVARRALALTALTARAILEQGPLSMKSQKADKSSFAWLRRFFGQDEPQRKELLAWVDAIGIKDELEPDEWEILQRPCGRLAPQQQINSTWRLEGLVVLSWALGKADIPPHDELVEFNAMWQNLGLFDAEVAQRLIATPSLRSREEIGKLRQRLFALHWRLRSYYIKPATMDFAKFARTCSFGPMDLSDVPLVDGDLALGGERIDRASQELFGKAHSASQERHQAINWLWEGPERYSEASVDT